MKKKLCWRRLSLLTVLSMVFSLALGCAACGAGGGTGIGMGGGFGASAASMLLRKTEGTVAVADAEGAEVAPEEGLSLYSGYTVGTEAESYAWIDLDKVKLAKLNQNSAVEITKDGKNLSIDVQEGGLFFNVTEPLGNDETMEISTSSMLVGIRGTCGWVSQKSVSLLEGTVTVTAGEQSVTINAGERARLTEDGKLEVVAFTYEAIPAFVARELLGDDTLHQAVFEASGLRIPTTYEELVDSIRDVVYSEMIDFEADGSPELLVIQDSDPDRHFNFQIYRIGADGPELLMRDTPTNIPIPTRYSCSLVERDGRRYVLYQTDGTDSINSGMFLDEYYGSVARQDGGLADWGMTDHFDFRGESRESISPTNGTIWVCIHNEKGFVDDMHDINNFQQVQEEQQAYLNKYTLVRELYATTPGS